MKKFCNIVIYAQNLNICFLIESKHQTAFEHHIKRIRISFEIRSSSIAAEKINIMYLTLFSVLLFSPLISGLFFGDGEFFYCFGNSPTSGCSFNKTFPNATSLDVTCGLLNVASSRGLSFEISTDGSTFDNSVKYSGSRVIKVNIESGDFLARVSSSQRLFWNYYSVKCCVKPVTETTTEEPVTTTTAEPVTTSSTTTVVDDTTV
ncbi:UNVERIFIED_CONTAM: hypothetical protein RMT77_010566 [Armadillidium vulgare]